MYSDESYKTAVKKGLSTSRAYSYSFLLTFTVWLETIEGIELTTPITEKTFGELREIWAKCVRLEKGFWDMGMSLS